MPVKVSVIVPVHDPGPRTEACVASLLGQSLAPDAYEIVFVDDGSGDTAPGLLHALAARDARVRVVRRENSGDGGPAEPRNAGIDAARGEYVMFVDDGDRLGAEALERMHSYGVANHADVVVGRTAAPGHEAPVELFRANRPRAGLADAPLLDSLTPHQMFRRAFLERTGLRFAEARHRAGDEVFVTEAYLRAGNVCVLADYVCYHQARRDDARPTAPRRTGPADTGPTSVREALDVVERYTAPGPLRDGLFRRWLRVELVEPLRGRRFLDLPEERRRELFTQVHAVIVERFGPGAGESLPPAQRVVAALAAEGRYDDVVAFARWESAVALAVHPEDVAWRDGVLRIAFTAELTHDGGPMTFPSTTRSPAGPPRDLADAVRRVGAETVEQFEHAVPDLLLRERTGAAQHLQPVEVVRETVPADDGDSDRVRLVLRAAAALDPATAVSADAPGEGLWDIWVRVSLGGWSKEVRLGPAARHGRPVPPAAVVAGRVVLPYWTERYASLALDVGHATTRLGLGRVAAGDVDVEDGRLHVDLPLHVPESADAVLRLVPGKPGATWEVIAELCPGGRLTAGLPVDGLRGATWPTSVCLSPDVDGTRFHPLPFALHVDQDGVLVVPAPQPGGARHLARKVRRTLYRVLGRGTTHGG
ncbi:glycosyltransferase family 2 protein [Streptomyces sp. NPDC048481]|uniref:glycosyltransferase family 2 protein n=1 Tax=Streptomyces sp. NPDC048481 TaxID=3365557 RepID=UPI00372280A6